MRKKQFVIPAAAFFMLAAVSCGRTVPLASLNGYDIPVAETIAGTDLAEQSTELQTEPATEVIYERVTVDLEMPENYQLPDSYVLDFETVYQEPELPTGCEITSLAQTMNYYGFEADKVFLCDTFLKKDYVGYYCMNDAYLGDPHSTNGFGCNAPAIVNAADDYFEYLGSDWYAVDLTGISLREAFYQVEQGRPVVVWTTIGQRETYAEFQFTLGCGEDFYFNPYQHCATIYGYDYNAGIVYIADPLAGNQQYELDRFERIYEIMGCQSVVLVGNDESAGESYTTDDEKAEWLAVNRPKEENDNAAWENYD